MTVCAFVWASSEREAPAERGEGRGLAKVGDGRGERRQLRACTYFGSGVIGCLRYVLPVCERVLP